VSGEEIIPHPSLRERRGRPDQSSYFVARPKDCELVVRIRQRTDIAVALYAPAGRL
jgi:hypothetical protein